MDRDAQCCAGTVRQDIRLKDTDRASRECARNPVKSVSYTARQALFVRSDNGPKLIMLDGMVQTLDLKSRQLAVTRFGDFTYDLAGLIARQGPEPRKVEELTTSELFAATPALLE